MSKRIVPVNKFPAPASKKSTTSSPVPPKTKTITKKHDGPFLLMDLPSELRRQILEYTCLVVRPLPNLSEDSLTIYEGHCTIKSEPGRCCGRCKGQCQCPSQQCACYAFSSALFYTCKTLSMEAREICFSMNRIGILDQPRVA